MTAVPWSLSPHYCSALITGGRHWEYHRSCIGRRVADAVLPSLRSALAGCACTLPDRYCRLRVVIATVARSERVMVYLNLHWTLARICVRAIFFSAAIGSGGFLAEWRRPKACGPSQRAQADQYSANVL